MKSAVYGAHTPVMVEKVVELILTSPSGQYIDATANGGGHTAALLQKLDKNGKIFAIDRDKDSIVELSKKFNNDSRIQTIHANFRNINKLERLESAKPFKGILFDFGISSHMIDLSHSRGFSHRVAGPLDMRMDIQQDLTADQIVNEYDEKDLAVLIRNYSEERYARRIAHAIVKSRPVKDTIELADIIRSAVPVKEEAKSIARVFQSIRIVVNEELSAIEAVLPQAVDLLEQGGRMITLAYHSLEDRIVKRFINDISRNCICPPRQVVCTCGGQNATVKPLFRKVLKATDKERNDNIRSRSVRLRAIEKL
ncbi:MAG: 16S rRNA (cytosine(1402)-N(4))-methyltransferase RsmH [Candidatus Electryonea clarkiae]|nr:16S rRNA (cytosine(1402)-N(4))-methyltransferase RsmH [Candidatus Electryonea clarkiae]MDP8285826.1 16S rRNA (cytosine(1402)-N(4))-methyltransferase RsmH [Candidatus Electryonea clarkiae]